MTNRHSNHNEVVAEDGLRDRRLIEDDRNAYNALMAL